MAEEQGQERTEKATPKRLREAKEKGQVARSRELSSMLMLMLAGAGLLAFGERMMQSSMALMQQGLSPEPELVFDTNGMLQALAELAGQGMWLMLPLLVLLLLAALIGPAAVGGLQFSTQALAFKFEKLDPVKGLARIFSARGLMELAKTLAKFVLVVLVAGVLISSQLGELAGLGNQPLPIALAHSGHLLLWSFLAVSSVMILIAAIDVPFQLWQHAKQLRMTRQELKDENKETEGHPEVKGKVRSMQRQIAMRRMMDAVPKADVVITNPTHYAVALRYDALKMGAPRVVAKGADLIAARIRGIAKEHGVILVEAPPLARALYATTELDQEIPANLYLAVAQVLAYVYQLKTATGSGREPPEMPDDLPVPDEFL